jgi:hypothetical protein
MASVKIALAFRAPSLTAERFGKFDMVIPYTIDGAGPFDVRVPEENYTSAIGEEAVRKAATAQVALKDRELTI